MEGNNPFWLFQFLGRLHPLVVHFPIGLLFGAVFLEILTLGGKRKGLRDGIVWLVYLGAISSVLASLLGWLLSNSDSYGGDLVLYHRNVGLATMVTALVAAALLWLAQRKSQPNYSYYRSFLFLSAILLTIAGHLGASLTHGEDFLTSTLPGYNQDQDSSQAGQLLTQITNRDTVPDEDQLDRVSLEVRAIFAHNCYQCHSEEKEKGGLKLDSREGVFSGGESGPVIVMGSADKSELVRRISLPRNHDDVMPKKGKVLTREAINLIRWWIDNGAHWVDGDIKVFPEAPLALSKPRLPPAEAANHHPIDRLLNSYFKGKDITWPQVVDDRTYIRRAYMDVVGLLPDPVKVEEFINSPDPNKRRALVRELLSDDHNYTQNWLSFWNDLLRNDYSGPGFITGGREQITNWLYQSLLENKPYHQMVRELTDPTPPSQGFIKGIQWRGAVNASQTTAMQAAQNIGQSLMGINVKCASCHNSFVSNLTLDQTYAFANVFSDTTLELYRCDMPTGKTARLEFIYPELGAVEAETVKERLRLLAENIVKPENGRLYRTLVNRIWERLTGRGIVEPLDEMDNTPWNADLLDWVAADFLENGSDMKYLIELIMTSNTYQLPAVAFKDPEAIRSNNFVFKGPLIRRLTAEQFTDAISQVVVPVYASVAYNPADSGRDFSRIWHREIEFDRDVLPKPGKRYFRRSFTLSGREVSAAKALISVDHSYKLYINSKQVASGSNWKKTEKVFLDSLLIPGENILALEGDNEGPVPNPAGILFVLQIIYEDGSSELIKSDDLWRSTENSPVKSEWTSIGYDDSEWVKVKKFNSSPWGDLISFNLEEDAQHEFARASLVKLDPFLKALGRPTRENVTTSRDDQATLLQAMELTNGVFFNDILEEGAKNWLKKYGTDNKRLTDDLYLKCLGRRPNKAEARVLEKILGNSPDKESVQDVFWATLLLPEFQFIN